MFKLIFGSTVGKKIIAAVSGCCLLLFVIGHMAGNLQIFLGAEAINRYAHFLKTTPELLWPVRIGLLAMALLHVWSTASLWVEGKRARGTVGYAVKDPAGATWASRTMIFSGLVLFVFIVFHLAHYTWHWVDPHFAELQDAQGRHDVYQMMLEGFSNPWVVGFYLISVALLSVHLSHGAAGMFRSVGLTNPFYRKLQEKFALAVAAILFAGMGIVPAAVLGGWVR